MYLYCQALIMPMMAAKSVNDMNQDFRCSVSKNSHTKSSTCTLNKTLFSLRGVDSLLCRPREERRGGIRSPDLNLVVLHHFQLIKQLLTSPWLVEGPQDIKMVVYTS